jgi:NTE family protein
MEDRGKQDGVSIGVALGGGGAAGLAHVGILEELTRAGVPVDCVAGTSAGAIVGAAFASGNLSEFRETMTALTWSRVLTLFDPRWPQLGLFEGRRGLDLVRHCLGDRIEDLQKPFAAVATDLQTGEEVILDRGPVADAVRASIALPGVFTPHPVDGRVLVDGALANPIPVSVARLLGAQFVIAVSIHEVPLENSTWPMAISAGTVARRAEEMGIWEVLVQSSVIVQTRIAAARFTEDPPDIFIVPPTANVGLFELHRAREVIEAGRKAARDVLPRILNALHDRGVPSPSRKDSRQPVPVSSKATSRPMKYLTDRTSDLVH